MLFLKSILVIALLQLVLAQSEDELHLKNLPKGLDENKALYEHLKKCTRYTCSKHFQIDINDKSEYQSCQVGCQSSRNMAKNCHNICSGEPRNFADKQLESCVKGCEHKKADEPNDVDVKPVETPTVVEKGPIVIDDIKAPNNADAPRPNLIDVIGALKKEDENHKDKDVPANLIDGIENIFKPFLVNGQPGAQDDPVFIEIKPIDEEDDDDEENKDDDNSSSVEASKEKPAVDEAKPEEEMPSNFGFLNPFKLASIVSSVIERAKNKIGSGNFRYYAKFLENGTVLESFEKPSESNEAMRLDDNDEAPFKIMNALLNDHRLAGEDVDEEHRHAGLHPNWKGRPLPIGQPIIENLDEFNRPPPFRMYRECRPIKFQFSTLCHDINNFFNCVSMRTGLPRWFFMSLILLCSFFMLWLGIFILSMIRRMKRQERIIQYEEDQLPLYKDIVFEEKLPPTYTETSEALPEKMKFETA